MFVIKKNQVIITALVLMIGTAGYLNFADSRAEKASKVVANDSDDIAGIVPEEDIYGDIVLNEEETITTNADAVNNEDEEAGKAVFVNNSKDTSYFVQAKLEREQARAKQKDILTEVINNNNVDQSKKSNAADEILKIQERIEKETASEAMIEAKGFNEVYVRIDDDTVDVVVNKAELNESEIAQIEDIIKRKTGASVDKIRISPIKK